MRGMSDECDDLIKTFQQQRESDGGLTGLHHPGHRQVTAQTTGAGGNGNQPFLAWIYKSWR